MPLFALCLLLLFMICTHAIKRACGAAQVAKVGGNTKDLSTKKTLRVPQQLTFPSLHTK